jgi:hypothetical protein
MWGQPFLVALAVMPPVASHFRSAPRSAPREPSSTKFNLIPLWVQRLQLFAFPN